ncbi:MAG TPA: 2-oxoisovalerate dehydrogenase [Candidatus Lokiarchaeia archaeon]|nr:2-oxoisovalerate dehydrogenase [Candidatus Lokiarchaeia archaeon]
MNELIFSVEESVDGGYEARALGVSIYTEVENLEDLKKEIRDAVQCYFETEEMPRVI